MREQLETDFQQLAVVGETCALSIICSHMFGTDAWDFPLTKWVGRFPLPVILYGLVETELKQRRSPRMTFQQLAGFADTVMQRRYREEQAKDTEEEWISI